MDSIDNLVHGHVAVCVENSRLAIAENNGWTLADEPSTPESLLTPETLSEAIEWLGNGNAICSCP